jgi:hypothetical protein
MGAYKTGFQDSRPAPCALYFEVTLGTDRAEAVKQAVYKDAHIKGWAYGQYLAGQGEGKV